ncbi:hypothetical protein EBU58_04410 [bacterium]|nr:hypothetical protein [bacterium]
MQQVVLFARKDFEHGPVICDHREDQVLSGRRTIPYNTSSGTVDSYTGIIRCGAFREHVA